MWNADLSAGGTGAKSIDEAARAVEALGVPWAWYRAGQHLELVREGATRFDWPRRSMRTIRPECCATRS